MNKFMFALFFTTTFTIISQNNVTICWDISLSMDDRKIESEFSFLDNYFTENKNITVTLLTFSNTINEMSSYTIINSDWRVVKTKLLNSIYDGATSYKQLPTQTPEGDILLFTDGYQNYNETIIKFRGNLQVISANPSFNEEYLNQVIKQNNGVFINLLNSKNQYIGIEKEYNGKIYSQSDIVSNISITIKDSNILATTNNDGSYKINAKSGDVLVFSYYGQKIKEKELDENVTNDIWLDFEGEQLDVVLISGKKKEASKVMIQTASGNQSKDKVGYDVQSINSEDFSGTGTTLTEALEGKVTGLQKGINDDISQSVIRGIQSMYGNNNPLILIDGVPIARSNSKLGGRTEITDFINIDNIADVSVLKGFAATNIYGSEGSNGVILITTKLNSQLPENINNKNTALVKNNLYKENLERNNIVLKTPYLNEFDNETNVIEAYGRYLIQREKYWDNPYYFIDIFNLFKVNDKELSYKILSNIIEKNGNSIIALRGMLFTSILNKNHQLSLKTSKIILKKFPNKTQSYMDVALANKNIGNYQEATNLYLGIINGSINNELDFSGLKGIAENEIRNLISAHKKDLNLKRIPLNYQKEYSLDIRIVFDWNNPEAEFELQFVNPSKRFFNWEHTRNNTDRIEDELKNGYSQEQFEIDGGEKGEWIINVKYLGNRTLLNKTPTFLKYTVQYNYGKPNQIDKEFMIRLYKKDQKELITKLYTR